MSSSRQYRSRSRSRSPSRGRRERSPTRRREYYSPRRRDYSPRRSRNGDYSPRRRYDDDRSPRRRDDYERRRRPVDRGSEEERMNSVTLFVGNLPYSYTEADLRDLFTKAGSVKHASVPIDRNYGRGKGFGFVEFEDRQGAEEAMKMFMEYETEGRRLRLDWDIGASKKGLRSDREPRERDRSPRPRDRSRSRSPRD